MANPQGHKLRRLYRALDWWKKRASKTKRYKYERVISINPELIKPAIDYEKVKAYLESRKRA